MGGAIAVRVAAKGVIPSIIGLIVIDVVEGCAIHINVVILINMLPCYLIV